MAAQDSKPLKASALLVAIVFALCVVCTATGFFFFGSSKIRPLFGMSAEALGGAPVKKGPSKKTWDNFADAGAY